jgi:translation initiation factor SUI1
MSRQFASTLTKAPVHIWIGQRNGKKGMCIIEDLDKDLDKKKILKYLRKHFHVNGAVLKDKHDKEVIKIHGKDGQSLKKILEEWKVVEKNRIVIHGGIE